MKAKKQNPEVLNNYLPYFFFLAGCSIFNHLTQLFLSTPNMLNSSFKEVKKNRVFSWSHFLYLLFE